MLLVLMLLKQVQYAVVSTVCYCVKTNNVFLLLLLFIILSPGLTHDPMSQHPFLSKSAFAFKGTWSQKLAWILILLSTTVHLEYFLKVKNRKHPRILTKIDIQPWVNLLDGKCWRSKISVHYFFHNFTICHNTGIYNRLKAELGTRQHCRDNVTMFSDHKIVNY